MALAHHARGQLPAGMEDQVTIEVDGAVRIGGFVIEQPYGDEPGKVGIYRYQHGGGGNFDAAALEALIAAYYEENF